MRAIVSQIIISSISTSADKSLRFRASTPELDDKEAVAFMGLRGINLRVMFEPIDYPVEGKTEFKSELSSKTPSVRLRACLYVLWKQLSDAGKISGKSADLFYSEQMERIINDIKSQLAPE